MSPVPGIHHRHMGVEGGRLGRALPGSAHDHHIGVAGDHFDGVLQSLALCHRGGIGIGKAKYSAAQAEHCGLEGEIGTGGRLIKEVCRHLSPAHIHKLFRRVNDPAGPGIQLVPLLSFQIAKVNQMPHTLRSSFFVSRYPTTNPPLPQGGRGQFSLFFPKSSIFPNFLFFPEAGGGSFSLFCMKPLPFSIT